MSDSTWVCDREGGQSNLAPLASPHSGIHLWLALIQDFLEEGDYEGWARMVTAVLVPRNRKPVDSHVIDLINIVTALTPFKEQQ